MHTDIIFPNMGLHLKNVGQNITVFGFEITYYGIAIGLGMLLGAAAVMQVAKKTGQDPEHYLDLALLGIFIGVAGARLYYVLFNLKYYISHPLSIFNLRQGGLAIYGGIIAGAITVFFYAKKKQLVFMRLADTACIGLLIGQIIGRWGNFFNREAFGGYTDGIFAMQLPVDAVRTGDITEALAAGIVQISGVNYIQVHPTFLYESLWNLGILLIAALYTKRKRFDGEVFLIYLLGYGIGRFWIESMRTDQLLLPWIGLPVSQVIAAMSVLASVAGFLRVQRKKAERQ